MPVGIAIGGELAEDLGGGGCVPVAALVPYITYDGGLNQRVNMAWRGVSDAGWSTHLQSYSGQDAFHTVPFVLTASLWVVNEYNGFFYAHAAYRTPDGGANWSLMTIPLVAAAAAYWLGTFVKGAGGRVWCATLETATIAKAHIWYSDGDAADATWVLSHSIALPDLINDSFHSEGIELLVHPNDPSIVVLSAHADINVGADTVIVVAKTADDGGSWSEEYTVPAGLGSADLHSQYGTVLLPSDRLVCVIRSRSGVDWRARLVTSDDWGATWVERRTSINLWSDGEFNMGSKKHMLAPFRAGARVYIVETDGVSGVASDISFSDDGAENFTAMATPADPSGNGPAGWCIGAYDGDRDVLLLLGQVSEFGSQPVNLLQGMRSPSASGPWRDVTNALDPSGVMVNGSGINGIMPGIAVIPPLLGEAALDCSARVADAATREVGELAIILSGSGLACSVYYTDDVNGDGSHWKRCVGAPVRDDGTWIVPDTDIGKFMFGFHDDKLYKGDVTSGVMTASLAAGTLSGDLANHAVWMGMFVDAPMGGCYLIAADDGVYQIWDRGATVEKVRPATGFPALPAGGHPQMLALSMPAV